MSTQAERLVRIEHKDGRRYSVSEADFKHKKLVGLGDQTYQNAGFEIVAYEDGTPYEEGTEPTSYAIASYLRAPEMGTVEEAAAADSGTTTRTSRVAESGTSTAASSATAATTTAEAS